MNVRIGNVKSNLCWITILTYTAYKIQVDLKSFSMNIYSFITVQRFLMNDKPFTCPLCGARCRELADFCHTNAKQSIQQCLSEECGFICGEEEEEDFLNRL